MAKITHIKITWGGVEVLNAETGDLSGTDLTIDHPKWVLKDTTARTWVTGTAPVCVVNGVKAPTAVQIGRGDASYRANMKLKTYGGPSGKCVFKT
jgi:hypothetical protein